LLLHRRRSHASIQFICCICRIACVLSPLVN
jgi:hypothetical protein